MSAADDICVSCKGPGIAAALPWRWRGELRVTIVVKGALRFTAAGKVAPVAPAAIYRAEKHYGDDPARPVRHGSDLVPTKEQAELLFAGSAPVPSDGRAVVEVRFGIAQGRRILLDKRTEVPVATEGAGLGPLASSSPERQKLLGGQPPPRLEAQVLELSDPMDLAYFQSAPSDQRFPATNIDGEQLLLQGLLSTRQRLALRLPRARATAAVAVGGHRTQVVLRCDTVAVDADDESVLLVWRGDVPLADAHQLDRLRVEASLDWGDAERRRLPLPQQPTAVMAGEAEGTVLLSVESPADRTATIDPLQVRPSAALPFTPTDEPAPAPERPLPPLAGAPWSSRPAAAPPPPAPDAEDTVVLSTAERPPHDAPRDPAAAVQPSPRRTPAAAPIAEREPTTPSGPTGAPPHRPLPEPSSAAPEATAAASAKRRWRVGPEPGPIGEIRPARTARRSRRSDTP